MTSLVIGPEQKDEIRRLVSYAKANALRLDRLMEISASGAAVGDDLQRRAEIPFGFRIVFSIEQHLCGWCRHVSVSIAGCPNPPHPLAMGMIMQELGFRSPGPACHLTAADLEAGARYGIISLSLEDNGRVVDLIELDFDLGEELETLGAGGG